MLKHQYAITFKIQLFYLLLCIFWNAIALWQIQSGQQPIGPTASTAVIANAVFIVAFLGLCLYRNWSVAYLMLSLLIFILAVFAIYGGVTKNSDLWPTSFWRVAGIVVNLVGVVSFLSVVRVFIGRRYE